MIMLIWSLIIFYFFIRYDAVIDAITDDGMVAISFIDYGNSDVTKLSMLRERKSDKQGHSSSSGNPREGETSRWVLSKWVFFLGK